MKIQGPIEVLVTGELREFALSKLPDELRAIVEQDAPVTEKSVIRLTDFAISRDVDPVTDIDGLTQSVNLTADFELDAGFFAPGDAVQLAHLEIPWPEQSLAPYNVPADKMLCAVELAAALGAKAAVRGTLDGISIGLRADGRAEIVLRFFKEFPKATGARTALLSTFRASKTPFNALAHPPQTGETLVAEFSGDLKLGAEIGYGWTVGGSQTFGDDLAGVDLTAVAKAEARVGLSGAVRIQGAHNLVVRQGLRDPAWLNVSFVKRRSTEATLAVSVSAEIDLRTGGGPDGGATTAEFVDGLLGRTPLPGLMARIRRLDPESDVEGLRAKIKKATIARLTEALRSGLEPAAVAVDAAYAELTKCVEDLVAAYDAFDAKVLAFVENAMESSEALSEFDAAVDTVEGIALAGDLQGLLDNATLAGRVFSPDEVRRIRQVVEWTRTIYGDSTPIESWIRNGFSDLKRLVASYREKRDELKQRIETAYRKLKNELAISATVEKIRKLLAAHGDASLESLLDEKIVWLDTHLSTRLNKPVDKLAAFAAEVKGELQKLVDGYDRARAKAAGALEKALNRNLMLHASLAWSRLQTNQTLASVDIDPASQAGKRAYRHLLRGDIAAALDLRRDNAGAIRFWRSYLQDDLCRDFTIRADINGRARVTIDRFLLSSATQIEATDDGEIFVQSVKTGDETIQETRRKLVHVQTMLEMAFEEHFVRADDRLVRDTYELKRSTIGYSYVDDLKGTPDVKLFRKRLKRAETYVGWLLNNDAAWAQAQAAMEATMGSYPIKEIEIRVDASLSSSAFATIFDPHRDRAELGTTLAALYDKTFDLMPFTQGMPEFPKTFVKNAKKGYVALLLEIHRDVFVDGKEDRVRPLVTKLGKAMKDLDVAGQLFGRNFAMTMFTLLAAPRDRGGSLRIVYTHPVTGLPTETRFDRLPEPV